MRHGAQLLLCGDGPRIEAEYILVESGGLLQCGAETAPYTGPRATVLLHTNILG